MNHGNRLCAPVRFLCLQRRDYRIMSFGQQLQREVIDKPLQTAEVAEVIHHLQYSHRLIILSI
ncbi:hypothetical protein D3C75_1186280 [compost metagenome]